MINFSEITYIKNSSSIGLINAKNKQFMSYDVIKNSFKGNGIHPFLINKDFEDLQISEFFIILTSNPNSQNVITYGNQISLMTKDTRFIVCLNNGEIRLEKIKEDKVLSSNIPPNSKFTIIDPDNHSNFSRPLLYNDEIILRSNFGNFLMIGLEDNVSSSGMINSEETVWKITKTNVAFFPDWLTKRKFLNHNNISYLFNLEKYLDQNNRGNNTGSTVNNISNANLNAAHSNYNYTNKKVKSSSVPDDKISLMTLSLELQEKLLIEDLLLVMMGADGIFIKRSGKKDVFPQEKNGVTKNLTSEISQDPGNFMNNQITQNNIFKNFVLKFEIEPYLDNPTCGKL